jgi:hypothetical protein
LKQVTIYADGAASPRAAYRSPGRRASGLVRSAAAPFPTKSSILQGPEFRDSGPGGWGGFAEQIRRMSPLARRLRGNRSGMTGALRRPAHKEKA